MKTIDAKSVMELRSMTGAAMMQCKKALTETQGDLEQAKDLLRKKGLATALKKMSREAKEGKILVAPLHSSDQQSLAVLKLACETDFVARNENFHQLHAKLIDILAAQGEAEFQSSLDNGEVKNIVTAAVSEFGENIQVSEYKVYAHPEHYFGFYLHTNSKLATIVEMIFPPSMDAENKAKISHQLSMHIAATRVESVDTDSVPKQILEKEREIFTDQLKQGGKKPELIDKIVASKIEKFLGEICLLKQKFLIQPEHTIEQWLASLSQEKITVVSFAKHSFSS